MRLKPQFKLSRNFKVYEFQRASSAEIKAEHWENLLVYMIPMLQYISDWTFKQGKREVVTPTSFIRSEAVNKANGGAMGSPHLESNCGAVDIVIGIGFDQHEKLYGDLLKEFPDMRFCVYKNVPGRADVHLDPGYILGQYNQWQKLDRA